MQGKRKKDPAYYELHETLGEMLDIVETYLTELQAELATAEAKGAPDPLFIDTLNGHIEIVKAFEDLLEEEVWPAVITIGNRSAYVSHRRTGEYF